MEASLSTIRGLINDLTRTLTGSLVHMDDLLLRLDNDSGEFDDAWLANNQLERALEFFIELRSEYMIRQESVNQKKTKSYKLTAVEKLLHNFNNLLAVVVGYCDIIQDNSTDVPHICQSTSRIYKSIQKSHHFIDETICLSDSNDFLNRLTLSSRKIKQSSTEPKKKINQSKRILLVEDNQDVKDFITMILRKHKYIVVGCSNSEKALAKFEQYKYMFDLYIVDVGLPDIEGPDLVKKLLLKKPNINILFTSGYNETKLKEHFALIGLHQILIKPFRLEELLKKVRSIIF